MLIQTLKDVRLNDLTWGSEDNFKLKTAKIRVARNLQTTLVFKDVKNTFCFISKQVKSKTTGILRNLFFSLKEIMKLSKMKKSQPLTCAERIPSNQNDLVGCWSAEFQDFSPN